MRRQQFSVTAGRAEGQCREGVQNGVCVTQNALPHVRLVTDSRVPGTEFAARRALKGGEVQDYPSVIHARMSEGVAQVSSSTVRL